MGLQCGGSDDDNDREESLRVANRRKAARYRCVRDVEQDADVTFLESVPPITSQQESATTLNHEWWRG